MRCPLTYYLTYGLHLKEQKSWADLRTRGSILHTILEKLTNIYGEKFATCDRQVLQDTLNAEYAWLENTFPSFPTKNDFVDAVRSHFPQFSQIPGPVAYADFRTRKRIYHGITLG